MKFFNEAGEKAIGSRVRLLAEKITSDAGQIYGLYDIKMAPKWFPVFYVLSQQPMSVTAIAREIGHSHPSVSKIVQEMARAGYVQEKNDRGDGRRNVIQLSPKGRIVTEKIQHQYGDVQQAVEEISQKTTQNLWKAIEEWEQLLNEQSLFARVIDIKKSRERSLTRIAGYRPQDHQAFQKLNEAWIRKYFKMEKADHLALDNPEAYILDPGGAIIMAFYNDKPVGTCALIKMKEGGSYELAKMAVSPEVQGKGIGKALGEAAIRKARSLGATRLYLESNTKLKAAISLYYKLGFIKVVGLPSPYKRANIQMELTLRD